MIELTRRATGFLILAMTVLIFALAAWPADPAAVRETPGPITTPCESNVAHDLGISWSPDDGATEELDAFDRLVAERCPTP